MMRMVYKPLLERSGGFNYLSGREMGPEAYGEAAQLTSVLTEMEEKGYDLSKFPAEDIRWAKSHGSGVLGKVWFFIKKFAKISEVIISALRFVGIKPKKAEAIKEIERRDAFKIWRQITYISCIIAAFTGYGLLYSGLTALMRWLHSMIIEFQNWGVTSKAERKYYQQDMLKYYDIYINGLKDVKKQAKQREDKKVERNCEQIIEFLEESKGEFIDNAELV